MLGTVEAISSLHGKAAAIYSELGELQTSSLHKTMDEFFGKMLESTKSVNSEVQVYLTNPAKYCKRELTGLGNLLKEWEASKKQAVLLSRKLKRKKEKLFESKAVEKWQLAPDCKHTPLTLLSSKEVAFHEMLPAKTQQVARHKETYGYYSNKVKEEFKRICETGIKRSKKQLKELTSTIKSAIIHVWLYLRK